MKNGLEVLDFQRPDLCTPCGGKCCKAMPGSSSPEDWGAPNEKEMALRLAAAFRSGKWTIDWWEGDPRIDPPEDEELDEAYFIRPAQKDQEGRLRHGSWGGECTFLHEKGCSLTHDERPFQCRALIPAHDATGCEASEGGEKRDISIAWIPYHKVILTAERLALKNKRKRA